MNAQAEDLSPMQTSSPCLLRVVTHIGFGGRVQVAVGNFRQDSLTSFDHSVRHARAMKTTAASWSAQLQAALPSQSVAICWSLRRPRPPNPRDHAGPLGPRHLALPLRPCTGAGAEPVRTQAVQAAASPLDTIEKAIKTEMGMQSTQIPQDELERLEAAIERSRYRATVGEIASTSGLSLARTEEGLKALAYDSQAVLQVSGDGDVIYAFSPNFKNQLLSKSLRLRLQPALSVAAQGTAWVARTVFGTFLVLSVILTLVTIALICVTVTLASLAVDDSKSSSPSFDASSPGGSFLDISLWWDPWVGPGGGSQGYGKLSFPQAVFSFIFGDGDPNKGFEEQRWRELGLFLRSRDGVAAAEEMAPFLDPPLQGGPSSSGDQADESFVLPALIKFGGEAFVDEEGHLLYRFPSLQKVASEKVLGVICLGLVNVGAVWWLSNVMAVPAVAQEFGVVLLLLPVLKAYASAFFTVPLFRSGVNAFRNFGIGRRNEAREQAALQLEQPSPLLARKLASARKNGSVKLIGKGDIIFTTEEEVGQQQNAREIEDWDKQISSTTQGRKQ